MNEQGENWKDDWNAHWKHYAESAQKNPAQDYRHRLIITLIKQAFSESDKFTIIDVGSGQGDLLKKIAVVFSNSSLIGFELSKIGAEISRKKVPQALFLEVDLQSNSLEVQKYYSSASVVCCSEVLEHLDEPDLILKQIYSLLAPGGMVLITVPGGPISSFDRYIGHRKHFSSHDVNRLLLSAGFRNHRVLQSGFPFFNLYRLLVILRGKNLKKDVEERNYGITEAIAHLFMSLFRFLFMFNCVDSRFGWQIVAFACK